MKINENSPDHNLVESLRNSDLEAFDLIFTKYGDRLYGFAFKYLKSKEEAEELVQDVFLKIWENRKNIKQEGTFRSYLFTIAYHHICRVFRKRVYHERVMKELSLPGDQTFIPDESIDYQSLFKQIDQLIDQLPPRQREIFIKSRKEGKSSREIAAELNIVPGTVDNQVSEALKFLRRNL